MEIPALATNNRQSIGTFRKSKTSHAVQWAASVLIAVVFSTAAFAKSRSFGEFEATLKASHLVPTIALSMLANAIIALEFSIALGILTPLLQPVLRRVCLHLASLLSCTFISYSIWRWHEGIAVPCHCFGAIFRLSPFRIDFAEHISSCYDTVCATRGGLCW